MNKMTNTQFCLIMLAFVGLFMAGYRFDKMINSPPQPQYTIHHDNELKLFDHCMESAPKWSQDGAEVVRQCRAMARELTRTVKGEGE